jgi:hypothetical protein
MRTIPRATDAGLEKAAASQGAGADTIAQALSANGAGSVVACVSGALGGGAERLPAVQGPPAELGGERRTGRRLGTVAGGPARVAEWRAPPKGSPAARTRPHTFTKTTALARSPPPHPAPAAQLYPSCANQQPSIGACCSQGGSQICGGVVGLNQFRRVMTSPLVWEAMFPGGQRCVCAA